MPTLANLTWTFPYSYSKRAAALSVDEVCVLEVFDNLQRIRWFQAKFGCTYTEAMIIAQAFEAWEPAHA